MSPVEVFRGPPKCSKIYFRAGLHWKSLLVREKRLHRGVKNYRKKEERNRRWGQNGSQDGGKNTRAALDHFLQGDKIWSYATSFVHNVQILLRVMSYMADVHQVPETTAKLQNRTGTTGSVWTYNKNIQLETLHMISKTLSASVQLYRPIGVARICSGALEGGVWGGCPPLPRKFLDFFL